MPTLPSAQGASRSGFDARRGGGPRREVYRTSRPGEGFATVLERGPDDLTAGHYDPAAVQSANPGIRRGQVRIGETGTPAIGTPGDRPKNTSLPVPGVRIPDLALPRENAFARPFPSRSSRPT